MALLKKTPIREGRYVNLCVDVAFKRVFAQPVNKDILIALLGTVLPELRITTLSYLDKEKPGFWRKAKKSAFDVLCEVDAGKKVIIEMQVLEEKDFRDRTLYYASQEILSQHKEGDGSYRLLPVYVVSFLHFTLPHESVVPGQVVWNYSLRENSSHEAMTDALHFTYVELARFSKREDELANLEEKFYFCLKHIHRLEERPGNFGEKVMRRLFEVAEVAGMNEREYLEYKKAMMTKADIRNAMAYAVEKATAEGLERGIQQGKLETAREFKKLGVSSDIISKACGMDVESVEAL